MKDIIGSNRMTWRIRTFITAISIVAVIFLFPASVHAGTILHASAIQAEQVIDNDVFLTGEKPVVEGTVNGDVFIVGTNVTISGTVNGSIFVVAQNIVLSGKVNGNLYAAAVELTQQGEGQISRSLYALTLSLITKTGSTIGRNLTTVAMSARLEGETERDTIAIIGPWELFKILRDVINQNIIGFVPGQPTLTRNNPEHVLARTGIPHRALVRTTQGSNLPDFRDWLFTALKSLVKFLLVGGLMLWIFPSQFQGWAEKVRKEPLASAGYGILVLINGYLVPVLILFMIIGLLLGLIYLSLPSLAWMTFGMSLGLLMAGFSLFIAATVFLSKAIVAYLTGTLILSRIASGSLRYRIIPLLLGLLIYVPLASVPYVGSFIGLVVTLLGLGSIWLSRKQAQPQVEAGMEPVSDQKSKYRKPIQKEQQ